LGKIALLRLKTFASQLFEVSGFDGASLCLLMMISAQRDEIVVVKAPVEIFDERRNVVNR